MPSTRSSNKPKAKSQQSVFDQPEPVEPEAAWSFQAIGTSWWIGIYESITAENRTRLRIEIAAIAEWFDAYYSRFREDSAVHMWAETAGVYTLPTHALPLFSFYRTLYEATNGAVTPLVGRLLSDAGYDASYSLQPQATTPAPIWDDVMRIDGNQLTLHEPVLLDFGAAGKGYLVDIISEYIESQGISQYCVDGSGDMRSRHSNEPLQVGLEDPEDAQLIVGVARLQNASLCGSAGNRRAWSTYTHIMNPFTMASPKHLSAVWVVANDTMTADGLATALYFVEPAVLRKQFTYEYALIRTSGQIEASQDFPASFFNGGDHDF